MAKTYQNLVDEAREILQDTDEDALRYSNAMLLNKLNRALKELKRLRPEAYWDTFDEFDVVVPEVVDDASAASDSDVATADLTDDVIVPDIFYTALVYFVVGSAELVDDEFAEDNRAMTLLTQFKAMVLSA
jgi:hypothetical protein